MKFESNMSHMRGCQVSRRTPGGFTLYGKIHRGPVILESYGGMRLWTVKLAITEALVVWPESELLLTDHHPFAIDIPIAECPSCEVDEMYFYEGDYVCAWCREVLEEKIWP